MRLVRHFILILLASAPALASGRDASAALSVARPLSLDGGQSLELVEVHDSRCPVKKRCARIGHVTLLLHWRSDPAAQPMRLTLATSNADGNTREACLNGTRIRLRAVAPLPRVDVTLAPTDYQVTVAIGRCENEGARS